MLHSIIGSSIRLRLLVVVAAVFVVVVAAVRVRATAVDAMPEFSPTKVEVQTEALGLSAAEVEQLITVPLEADLLNGVPWLATIRSESVPGLSAITMTFEPGTDTLRARQVVNERITQARALPNVSKPPTMLEPLSSDSRVLMIGLTPRSMSLIDASVLARWTIRPRLMAVPGVAEVATWGQRDQQLQVQVDPRRLVASGVTLQQLIQSTGNAMWVSPLTFLEASTPGTGGFIDTANQRLGIQHVSPIVSPETLAKVTIEDSPNKIVHIGDVATVVKDHQPLIGDATADGMPALVMVVQKFPGVDTLTVTKGLEEALADLGPGLTGLDVDTTLFRPATYIERAMGNVGWWALLGGLLGVIALTLLLASWRAALVALVSVAVSTAVAALVLSVAGATVNALVLAGLVVALGLMVDDAVVETDRALRRRAEHALAAEGRTWTERLLHGASGTRSALCYAAAIAVLVVVPVFFLGGQERALYQPFVLAYVLGVAGSTLVALTLTPALSAIFLGADRREGRAPVSAAVRRLAGRYAELTAHAVRRPRPVLLTAVVVAAFALIGLPFLTPSLVPDPKNPDLLVKFDGPPGTSLTEMDRITARASSELRGVRGVRGVGAHIGRAVLGDRIVDVNSAELWVSLDPSADYDKAVAAVSDVVHRYPGITGSVVTPERAAATAILGTAGRDVTVRLFGQDTALLRTKADEVATMLRGIDGVVDPVVESQVTQPTITVDVDLVAAGVAGIKPGDVRRAAATLLQGTEVGSLFQDQKVFDVTVRGMPATRDSVSAIQNLLVDRPDGGSVRLGDVAQVRIEARPKLIKREDVSRRIDVTADVRGRSVGAVTAKVTERLSSISFPLENHAEVLGVSAGHQADLLRVLAVACAALVGIFLLLHGAFASWRLAAAVFVALPVALSGCVLALLATGRTLELGSLAGMLLVFGIAARAVVLLVRHCQHLRVDGEPFGPGLVERAARERLRPTVTTALVVAGMFLPSLVAGPVAGLEVLAPMAVTVLGGLVTATLLATLCAPVLYLLFGSRPVERIGADMATVDGGAP